MARSRNIKPGFFVNELLAEMEPLTRILFVGLWTIADKEGRLEDRPKRIKVSCLPYDQVNVESCLDQLQTAGFILRYMVKNQPYIQIVNWRKHQSPHHKEIDSEIPPIPKNYQQNHDNSHEQAKHDPSMDKKNASSPLIPDSLNLIPDSLKDIGDTKKTKSRAFKKPTIDEIEDYCKERGNRINATQFFNHYEANGWMRGKNKIKNWKACVITWESNDNGNGNGQPKQTGRKTFDDYNNDLNTGNTTKGITIDG
jgi:hypothetical protein